PDQAVAERELHATDRLAIETVGRRQRQTREIGLDQVDGARVRVEPLADEVDDVAECLVQIVRASDDLGDVREQCDAIRNGLVPRDSVRVTGPLRAHRSSDGTAGPRAEWGERAGSYCHGGIDGEGSAV